MKYKLVFLAVLASSLSISSSFAQNGANYQLQNNTIEDDSGFFMAVGISRIQAKASTEFNNAKLDFNDSDNAYNFRLGYMFSNWVGIEAVYYDFGEFEDSLESTANQAGTYSADLNLDLKGYGLSMIANIPLRYVDLYVKAGAIRLDGEVSASAFGLNYSAKENSTEPFAAVGVEFDFGTVNLFAEYSRLLDSDDVEINFATAGIKLEF